MRFFVTVMSTPETEETFEPDPGLYEEMARFNQRLVDGPFTESKELVAGYWVIEVGSLEECVAWVRQVPNPMGVESEIQIRRIMGPEDFDGVAPPEVIEHEQRMRERIELQQD